MDESIYRLQFYLFYIDKNVDTIYKSLILH